MRATVGISFYNSERTLADAIRSVFAQTYTDWELVLVDDGSTDSSLEIAQAVDDPRVRVISDGPNRGLPARLNQIAQLAQGEYLARMDADDLMHPKRLEQQVSFLGQHPEIDVVGTGEYVMDAEDNVVGVKGRSAWHTSRSRQAVLRRQSTLMHATVMGRVEWFRRHPYDPLFVRAEDFELWVRTTTTSHFATLQRPLYFVRTHSSFRLSKYLLSCRTNRRVLRKYGPATVGWPSTLMLIAQSYLKGATYCIFMALGKQEILIRRRHKPITGPESRAASQAIEEIRQTPVPGLPSEPRGT